MEIKTVELTEVTLPDGSKAWFERRETAERICKVVDMLSDIAVEGKAASMSTLKRDKRKGNRTDNPIRKVEKITETKPKDESKSCEKKNDERNNAMGYTYAEKTCDICGNKFNPRCGRQMVCDECRNAGLNIKRNREKSKENKQAGEGKISAALAEVRKLAREAHLGPYKS